MKPIHYLILIAIGASVVIAHSDIRGWNDASRMATTQALVEYGTFSINQSEFLGTGDKVYVNGRFYSDKPPVPSIIAAAIYAPLYYLGFKFWHGATYYLITLLTMKVSLIAALWCFYKALRRTGLDDGARLVATGALALGSLMLPWTSVFNNHGLAACFVTIGFFAIVEARHKEDARIGIAAAGFFLSLAAVSDLATGAIYAAFGILVLGTPVLRRHAVLFFVPFFIAVVPYLLINYQISGSILPLQLNEEFFAYPGSAFIEAGRLSGIAANTSGRILYNAWAYLFGGNGFILYNPLLLVAVPMLLAEIWLRRPFWREALAVFGATCVIFLYYIIMTKNEGGGSFSIRWFVPILPLLFFFLYSFLGRISRLRTATFATLAALSVLIAVIGTVDPWSNKSINNVSLLANLKIYQ